MIAITGGAGMIGSMIAWHLNTHEQRDDLILVDRLDEPNQWQNLCKRRYANYLDRDELMPWLEQSAGTSVQGIVHMGAISATTVSDFNELAQVNIRYSQRLWQWCAQHNVPFIYASSAATYGGGEQGYVDRHDIDNLRPLNAYGYSKQFFDQWALRQSKTPELCPPQWVGLKFFNVYGPNEYHKGRMASVALHTYRQVKVQGQMKLFRSHRPDVADGMQSRDFIYVKDAAKVVAHFLGHVEHSGLYNVGTGEARSFRDLASSIMLAMGLEPRIEYIDMPEDLQGKYQYFTEANMDKLRASGYNRRFTSLEDGTRDYVEHFLSQLDPYA